MRPSTPEWIDSHCHVHDERTPDGTAAAVAAAAAAGVTTLITVGCDRPTSLAAIAVAAEHEQVHATVGLHPHDAVNGVDTIVDLLDTPGIVAVGEAGLDYYYDHSPRETQRDAFAAQIQLALDRGRASVVSWEEGTVVVRDLAGDGDPRPVGSADGVRDLTVAGSNDAPVQAIWAWRDLTTGRYLYHSTFADDPLQSGQLLPLVAVLQAGETWVFSHRGRDTGAEVVRITPGGEAVPLYRTDLQITGLSAAAADGVVHLTWVEGFTETTAFGSASDWRAQAAWWSPDNRWAGPALLGDADGQVGRTATAVEAGVGAVAQRTWTGSDGIARRWRVAAADPLESPALGAVALVAGRPIGTTLAAGVGTDFLVRGDTVWRVSDPAATPVAVAWSPVVIREGWAVLDAEGVHHLAWIGSEAGGRASPHGRDVLYGSDDRRPMARGPLDEIAAAFGWRPWSVAEEAAGQLGASLLAAILVAASTLPLLWALGAVFARGASAAAARWRGSLAGAALPGVGVLAASALGARADVLWSLVGGLGTLVGASAVAAILAAWLWRNRDLEAMPAFVGAGATALACATVGIAFVGFQGWVDLGLW